MDNNNTEIIKFAKHVTPQPTQEIPRNSNQMVPYGLDNLYPNFLLKLFSQSPLHRGIISKKTQYVQGDGLINKSTGEAYNPIINDIDTLEELTQKITIDYIIFGYFTIECIYNTFGQLIQLVHIPAQSVRTNQSFSRFHVCNDWFGNSRNVLSYSRWKRTPEDDNKSTLFFYKKFIPSVNIVYPEPDYSGAIKSLETDLAIRQFHLNNITNGFSVSTLITFYGAQLPPDQKREFQKKIEDAYSGQNGAKFIIDMQKDTGKGAEVKNIGANDWDKAYDLVKKSVEQDILVAHSTTSPLLFGIKTEGQLGGSTELEVAYELFKNLYVKNVRNEIEAGLNKLLKAMDMPEVEFKDKGSLFTNSISDATKEKVYTINELREIDGLEPLSPEIGDKLLGSTPAPVAKFSIEQPKAEDKSDYHMLTAEDFEKVKHLGTDMSAFTIIEKSEAIESFSHLEQIENRFDDNDAVNKYLLDAEINEKSLGDVRAMIKKELAIDVTISTLKETLVKLNDAGLLNVKIEGNSINAKPVEPTSKIKKDVKVTDAPSDSVQVMYSYQGPKDDRNRAFCAKILEVAKFYTRAEIATMSQIFGYDVWKFRGGWYKPDNQDARPFCRHTWHANQVKLKGDNK